MRPIFIVGLQGSGTSLLFRLLQTIGIADNPFHGEGKKFWGNDPPTTPTGHPAGTLYWRHGGEAGHELGEDDASEEVVQLMRRRLGRRLSEERPVVNKNPFNMVRIPWVRKIFPDAAIVGVARRPLPNVYSIAKRFVPHPGRGRGPDEDGWWGVKPRGWRALLDDDKVVQIARQWAATNHRMIETSALLDDLFCYHRICAEPVSVLRRIAERAGGAPPPEELPLPGLRAFDDEYMTGSGLRSKNRYWGERGSFEVPVNEEAQFPPFTSQQVEAVQRITADVDERLALLCRPEARTPER